MSGKSHNDVEFSVHTYRRDTSCFRTFADATAEAVERVLAGVGPEVVLDVRVWSRAGARWYGGDEGVKIYDKNPDTRVFERIVVKAHSKGSVA